MKRFLWKRSVPAGVLMAAMLLSACSVNRRVTESNTPVVDPDAVAQVEAGGTLPAETSDAADTADTTEDTPEETLTPQIDYEIYLSRDSYDDIRGLIGTDLFAVSEDGKWGVIDDDGTEVFPAEYDYFTTDGNQFFSLTRSLGGTYDATLYYYNDETDEVIEILNNEAEPDMDYVWIDEPYLCMASRDRSGKVNPLPVLFLEWDYTNGITFYDLMHLTENNITLGGFDASSIRGFSAFSDDIGMIGGSFVDYGAYEQEPDTGAWYNVYAVSARNEMLFTEDETDTTLSMLPYLPTDEGYFVARIIDVKTGDTTLAYGNTKDGTTSSDKLTPFPEEATDIVPYYVNGAQEASAAYAGSDIYVILKDRSGKEAVYDMEAGAYVAEFSDAQYQLADQMSLPIRVTQNGMRGYIRVQQGQTPPVSITMYDGASLYHNKEKVALVRTGAGAEAKIYLVDAEGRRRSEYLTGSFAGEIRVVGFGNECIFAVEDGNGVRFVYAD